MDNTEELRDFPVETYRTRYKVSNLGRIYSNRKNSYINSTISKGFNVIYVNKPSSNLREQFRVDKLVAMTFHGSECNILVHIDGDNLNDMSSNLKWSTTEDYLHETYGEQWKPIEGYEKYYISTDGRVWSSYNEIICKQQLVSGYMSVNIGYPKQLFQHVHRLVAKAFCDNPENKPVVNHKDMNKMNNHVLNLEWVTVLENNCHAIANLPSKTYERINISPRPEGKILEKLSQYIITSSGNVYSIRTKKYLKLHKNNSGYYRVSATVSGVKNNFYVHKLVAEAYLPNSDITKTQVNHKNLNRLDNRVENLEWCTPSENCRHSVINNKKQYIHLQKKVAQLSIEDNSVMQIYDGLKVASRETGINSGSICKVCKGVKPTAGGYKWKYIDQ